MSTIKNEIDPELLQKHTEIMSKIREWDELNQNHTHKLERVFLHVFTQIMERMGEEVKDAETKYQQVDMVALTDKHCVRLQKEVHFFREECVELTSKLEAANKQIEQLKSKNENLKREVSTLQDMMKNERGASPSIILSKKQSNPQQPLLRRRLSEQDEAIMGLVVQLQSQKPQRAIQFLKDFIKKEVRTAPEPKPESPSIPKISRRQARTSQKLLSPKHNQSRNEALEIWQECIRTAKAKEGTLPKFLAHWSKNKLLQTFFTSQRLIELVRRQLFGQKCCNNWNCINNIETNRNNLEISNELHSTKKNIERGHSVSESRRTSWGRFRRSKYPKIPPNFPFYD